MNYTFDELRANTIEYVIWWICLIMWFVSGIIGFAPTTWSGFIIWFGITYKYFS